MGFNDLPEGVTTPRVGDEILIRGTVTQYAPGVGVTVELFSKTDQYTAWVRFDLIADVILPDLPAEPADGTWLAGVDPDGRADRVRVFVRDDEGGPRESGRRHYRQWWDVAAQQWVDWPAAVRRGADPSRPIGVSL